jgi:hypothetical protein
MLAWYGISSKKTESLEFEEYNEETKEVSNIWISMFVPVLPA